MSNEKAIAAAIEPVVDQIVALERRIDAVQLVPGPKGDAGDPGRDADPDTITNALLANAEFVALTKGRDGTDGHDGAGIDSQQWQAGAIYRKGSVVVANIGQHFEALRDTFSTTDDPDHWKRVGAGGFRYRGAFKADAVYIDGDIFVNSFSTFLVVNGAPTLFAARGPVGQKGERGAPGMRGDNGRDGAEIIAAEAQGFKLVLVQQHADGSIDHIEADFSKAIRALLRETVIEYLREVAA